MLSWLPENVSSYGGEVDSIFYLIYYIVGAWFLLTQGFLVYVLVRYRRREGRRAVSLHGNTLNQAAWILLPCVLVLSLDLWIDFRSADVWAKVRINNPPADVVVGVEAKQFNWTMIYPGPDGRFGTKDDKKLKNELRVPVNKVVRVYLTGKDVIHSFFLPNLRLKQDVVPGRRIPVWFRATKPGKYEIPCAELCGYGHSGMKGWLHVLTEEDYRAWTKKQWPGS